MGAGSLVGAPTTYFMSKWLSPSPTAQNVGTKPQATTMPDPYANLSKVMPGLGQSNALAGQDLNAMLSGRLSPDTVNQIQDYAARMGMTQTGTAGAPFNLYGGAADIGKTSQALMQQGMADYSPIMNTISGTQTLSPALQAEIDTYNKQIAAAPDPVAAAKFAIAMAQIQQLSQGVGSGFSSLGDMAAMGAMA